ncbi:MAG TPA: phosphoribosylformylglycinamidine synthase subunit PurL [Acidobacteriaceae bacterium]|nr:phosphoribosylformylglycinamidine synthase subunit PurL [Acidobacteriaceae bacterium]
MAPESVSVTPELLARHSVTAEEYERIVQALGRVPSLTELGIYSVMWSEHCSYKSSRVHLKRLPTKSSRVVQGPGENAGIIDIGNGWACAFKIESHNHPSYIEPFQGAATGVGGILRDIFTMGARPLAVMDSLRFGPLNEDEIGGSRPHATALAHKNHSILEGVVSGIAGYGNCFGVPNLGGETRFESCYSGNPLVNAFALGLVKRDEIFYAKASGIGNPVIYVGAKTGRDGIHGATMASEEFKEGSEQKRPNVQVGDPFMEKLLLEACLEAMQSGAIVGIQDMGAAGLTCSTCEMGARGGVGIEIELARIPQRETGMSAYEIMLSESQERMLLVAEKDRAEEVLRIFAKWGLDAVIAGEVIAVPRLRILHHGALVADIPNQSLTDDAPLYHRPVGEWKPPVPADPPAEALETLNFLDEVPLRLTPGRYADEMRALLASSGLCSKRWIFEQYDSMVQTNTVQGPGGEAGVLRVKGTARGLAMALAGNGRWSYLDPELGAAHAAAEAARKVAATGAVPVAATNCLNFGNPEKPEIMAQLSAAIDGIAKACIAFGSPITGGNVSLYNETRGEAIYPTPVLGIVGILDRADQAIAADFQQAGDAVLLIAPSTLAPIEQRMREFGSSEYAKTVLRRLWGAPPSLDLAVEANLHKCMADLAGRGLLRSARDIADGGIAVALATGGFSNGIGVRANLEKAPDLPLEWDLFAEAASQMLVTASKNHVAEVENVVREYSGLMVTVLGETISEIFEVATDGHILIRERISGLRHVWTEALAMQLAGDLAVEN